MEAVIAEEGASSPTVIQIRSRKRPEDLEPMDQPALCSDLERENPTKVAQYRR